MAGVHVIAHRTLARSAPENTLAGLRLCIERGLTWAEADVRRSADGDHVLIHDATLDRTTNGRGPVAARTYPELRELDAGGGERIPTLREAFELAHGRLNLYLDCRDVYALDLVSEIHESGMGDQVLVFADETLTEQIRATRGGDRIAIVRFFGPEAPPDLPNGTGPTAVEAPIDRMDESWVARARAAGRPVNCLTLRELDTAENWRRAADLGATWIMTDFPGECVETLGDRARRTRPGSP